MNHIIQLALYQLTDLLVEIRRCCRIALTHKKTKDWVGEKSNSFKVCPGIELSIAYRVQS